MQTRMAHLTLRTATVALALSASTVLSYAQDGPTKPPPSDSAIEKQLQPKNHPVTEADIAECMKSWDPQTQMSRQDYEEACKRSLKYYPENPN